MLADVSRRIFAKLAGLAALGAAAGASAAENENARIDRAPRAGALPEGFSVGNGDLVLPDRRRGRRGRPRQVDLGHL